MAGDGGRSGIKEQSTASHEVAERSPSGGSAEYRPIGDYALVGNAQSSALVASDGTIDWLCLPHFDSPAILCRILDADKGGYLAIRPRQPVTRSLRRYRPHSTILETALETEGGSLRITDAMPVAEGDPGPALDGVWAGHGRHRVVRLLEAVAAPVDLVLEARLGFDFAATEPDIEVIAGRGAVADGGGGRFLSLVWPGSLEQASDGTLGGELTVEPGEVVACVLGYETERGPARALLDAGEWRREVAETDEAWRRWARYCEADGPYRDHLVRSALTLKMLTFEPTGALVAAPTTSLPEAIGGPRNWDYRYCWLRDATFTLYALLLVGDGSAADAFWRWIERTCAEAHPEQIQIMYGIHGERELTEQTLDYLEGYRGSQPVRVGNAAWRQRQLDVYGELLDAFWFFYQHGGRVGHPPTVAASIWALMSSLADYICEIWRHKDHGPWEMRGDPQHFVYSKVMCWAGLDRAIRLAEAGLKGDVERWIRERDAIHEEILGKGYSEEMGAFRMHYDTDKLDASLLRMPLVGFLPADEPRMRSTIEQIQRRLGVGGGLLLRYRTDDGADGLAGGEGAFAICSFWLVDCLVALGRIDEAREVFEQMLGYGNDLGLFAEEIDPDTGAALGNFPQAFTHLALIDAGVDLSEALARNAPLPAESTERAGQVRRGQTERGTRGTTPSGPDDREDT